MAIDQQAPATVRPPTSEEITAAVDAEIPNGEWLQDWYGGLAAARASLWILDDLRPSEQARLEAIVEREEGPLNDQVEALMIAAAHRVLRGIAEKLPELPRRREAKAAQ